MGAIHYGKDTDLTWKRIKKGSSFKYFDKNNKRISKTQRARIEALVIPPAWKEVVIAPDPTNYIQAIGTDARHRKQYIYHPDWIKKNQEQKFDQMIIFGERLPILRRAVSAHMSEHELTESRVIATVIWLLEHTFIRVGNKEYAKDNNSFGLTTLREKHVNIKGNTVTFSFNGKSGVFHELDVTNPRVAKNIKECIDLPGYELFQYVDKNKNKRVINSEDVNNYLQKLIGGDFSAKDFRTWGGSVLAGDSLYKKGSTKVDQDIKKNISETVKEVARHLGNTKSVCRTYYIHPAIINSYEKDILVPHFKRSYGRKLPKKFALTQEEYATWSLIKDY